MIPLQAARSCRRRERALPLPTKVAFMQTKKIPSRSLLPLLVLSALLTTCPGWAQDAGKIAEILRKAVETKEETGSKTPPKTRPEEKEELPIFLLRDRARIPARPAFETISVRTRYGILKIPREQLISVRFAPRIDPTLEKKTAALVKRLGSSASPEREAAADALVNLGEPVLATLKRLAPGAGEEVRPEILAVVSRIEKTGVKKTRGAGKYNGTMDEIHTELMTFRGEILTEGFPLKTRYGELLIKAVDLESIRFKADGRTNRVVHVAPSFQPSGAWFDTRMDVGKNKLLTIKSSGETSIGSWNLTADPDGTNRYSTFKSNQGFPMLSLVGKIGKSGKPFKAGKKYRLRSRAAGRLYLAIQPFDYEPAGVDGQYRSVITITDGP